MQKAFYLKYRPQTFADLDSTSAREELIKIFSSGRIPHAFLFTGSKGIGKTSAARIVAKAVNCERESKVSSVGAQHVAPENVGARRDAPVQYEPCNHCSTCASITNGTNVDVLEIDAASNRGIEDIKELRGKIKLSPASNKYKVYIIDEVHMLTTEAFNALLKTLEEPPEHAIFVLCTTDPEKLPKTIVSRCHRVVFKKATQKEIIERLKKICQAEKLDFSEEALEEIAQFSEGSFRDGTKILEQVSFSGKGNLEEVQKTVGILGNFETSEFLNYLKNQESGEALIWLSKAADQGMNLRFFTEGILEELRQGLLANFGIDEYEVKVSFSVEESQRLIEIFSKAYSELRFAVIPQLPLEMAVIEWGMKNEQRTMEGPEKERLQGGNNPNVHSSKFKVGDGGKKDDKGGEDVILSPPTRRAKDPEVNDTQWDSSGARPTRNDGGDSSFSLDTVVAKWSQILEKVRPLNHSVLAFLRASRPIACEQDSLVLEVFYKFHKDQLELEKSRRIFEQAASEVMQTPVKLKCKLGEGKPSKMSSPPLPPIEEKSKSASMKDQEDDIMKIAEEIFK